MVLKVLAKLKKMDFKILEKLQHKLLRHIMKNGLTKVNLHQKKLFKQENWFKLIQMIY